MKSAPRKAGKKPAVREKRISNIVRPSDLTSKEWQVALRRQAAQKENLIVRQPADEGRYGVYEVSNPLSRSVYKVVYGDWQANGTSARVRISRPISWGHAST